MAIPYHYLIAHGTCGYCKKRHVLCGMFNYGDKIKQFQLCKNCLEMGLYGFGDKGTLFSGFAIKPKED